MKVSVVIPTKEDEEVFDAIRSVKEQTYDDFEIIVVDASSGDHREKLEDFCIEQAVKFLKEEEEREDSWGLNASRNIGSKNAEGEIIALLDGDCRADENWLKNLVSYFNNFDIVESNVQYLNQGKNCPMDRVVVNSGANYSFLGAGLAYRKEIWEKLGGFDEDFKRLRNDTEFGFRALEKNFSYTYAKEASIYHNSGEFSIGEFMSERMRYLDEPLFYSKFKNSEHSKKELNNIGPLLHYKELGVLGALTLTLLGAIVTPYSLILTAGVMAVSEAVYLKRESSKRDLDFCPKQLLVLFFLVPLTFAVIKRYAIWKGAIKYREMVI